MLLSTRNSRTLRISFLLCYATFFSVPSVHSHPLSIMIPANSHNFSSEIQKSNKPKTLNFLKTTLNSIQTYFSSHPRFWLFITFLFVQALVIFIVRTPPPSLPAEYATVSASDNHLPPPITIICNNTRSETDTPPPEVEECGIGKIYVYDLPSMLNKDLVLANCTDLNPWNWQCGIVPNHGYGNAATEFAGIFPGTLSSSWYRTNQFSLELIFHHRMLHHKCRTLEPESATAFYIPFYAGLAVGKFLWGNDTAKRDWHCRMMLQWVKKQKSWQRSNGSDHFMAVGRITWDFRRLTDPGKLWGSSFLNMPEMQQVTRFTIEKAPGDYYDVSVPYPTGFHPKTKKHIQEWQNFVRYYNRSSLFTFIGAKRGEIKNDFRGLLLSYCYNESDSCRVVDCGVTQCSTDSSAIHKALLGSHFCLQPRGDSFTRRSVFDCMVAGSVPVFFWKRTAYDQYEWFLPTDPKSYSVFIDHEDVRNGKSIKEVLMRYSEQEIRRKRENLIEAIPRIIYAKPNKGLASFRDAFDIAVDEVLRRIKLEKEWADFVE